MVRDEVRKLLELGPPPSEEELIRNPSPVFERYEQLLSSVKKPVTDEEARLLTGLFGVDGCFGLGWTLLHLIETAPNWPEPGELENSAKRVGAASQRSRGKAARGWVSSAIVLQRGWPAGSKDE
jgi:hypothetical protein